MGSRRASLAMKQEHMAHRKCVAAVRDQHVSLDVGTVKLLGHQASGGEGFAAT